MVKIYYANRNALEEEALYEKGYELLPKERLEKLKRKKTKEGQLSCMAAGLLLLYGLKQEHIAQEEISIKTNRDGKPVLEGHFGIHFNMSHSGEYAAVAFGDCELGLDIEKPREGKFSMVERFFSPEEKEMLRAHWSDAEFTRIWTRKESYIKAIGKGLKIPLASFSTCSDALAEYTIKSMCFADDYWLSICKKGPMKEVSIKEISLEQILKEGGTENV